MLSLHKNGVQLQLVAVCMSKLDYTGLTLVDPRININEICYYLRQVNEVNSGDNVFVRCVSVFLCVRSELVGVKC